MGKCALIELPIYGTKSWDRSELYPLHLGYKRGSWNGNHAAFGSSEIWTIITYSYTYAYVYIYIHMYMYINCGTNNIVGDWPVLGYRQWLISTGHLGIMASKWLVAQSWIPCVYLGERRWAVWKKLNCCQHCCTMLQVCFPAGTHYVDEQ